jgi:hypothetical protein
LILNYPELCVNPCDDVALSAVQSIGWLAMAAVEELDGLLGNLSVCMEMKWSLLFFAILFFSGFACACGSNAQRENMSERLYADADMRKFVCENDSCSALQFENELQFHQIDEQYQGAKLSVCVIEPTLNAANSYTGVFASKGGDFEFQLISYGTGVKVGVDKTGIPMISEYSFSDPDNPGDSINQYLWNGRAFVFVRNVPLPN